MLVWVVLLFPIIFGAVVPLPTIIDQNLTAITKMKSRFEVKTATCGYDTTENTITPQFIVVDAASQVIISRECILPVDSHIPQDAIFKTVTLHIATCGTDSIEDSSSTNPIAKALHGTERNSVQCRAYYFKLPDSQTLEKAEILYFASSSGRIPTSTRLVLKDGKTNVEVLEHDPRHFPAIQREDGSTFFRFDTSVTGPFVTFNI